MPRPVFVATVVSREPTALRLSLVAPGVAVSVKGKRFKLSEQETKLISEETFSFEGVVHKVFGLVARGAIKRAHRKHIESFKRFAES